MNKKLFSMLISISIFIGFFTIIPVSPMVKSSEAFSTWHQTSDSDFISGTIKNVKIIGTGSNAELTIDMYDLDTGWTQLSPTKKPSARSAHKMAIINGTQYALLFGSVGCDEDTWIFNSSSNDWMKKTKIFSGLGRCDQGFAAVYNDDKVLMYGGIGNILGCFNDNELYDLSNDTWTWVTPQNMPYNIYSTELASIYGTDKVMLFGGTKHSPHFNDDNWIYDLSQNNWMETGILNRPNPRAYHEMSHVFDDDKIVMFGGNSTMGFLNDTWVFDLSDNSWTNKSPVKSPTARYRHTMAPIWGTDKILLMGGYDGNFCNDIWIYDVSSDTWSERKISPLPSARYDHAMAPVWCEDRIVLFGGFDGNNELDDTWIYKHSYKIKNGTYISSTYDTGCNSSFKKISWRADIPANTNLTFKLRTAINESELITKEFVGPYGTNNSYYSKSGDTIWTGHSGDRWIQYKVFLKTTEKTKSPSLKDITISYNCLPIPIPISPINASIINTNKPVFNWLFIDDNNSQTGFQVLIDDDIGFDDINFDSKEQSSSILNWEFPLGTDYTEIADGIWYWKVRIKDIDGDWGHYCAPVSFIIDTQAPKSKIIKPEKNKFYNFVDVISGTASDTIKEGGISKVEVAINRVDDNHYWSGVRWVDMETWVLTTSTTGMINWYYDPIEISWEWDGEYKIFSRAIDIAGNVELPGEGVIFYIDTQKPESCIDVPDRYWLNGLTKITGGGFDVNGSGVNYTEIKIENRADSTYWTGNIWDEPITWLTASRTKSWWFNTSNITWTEGTEYTMNSRTLDMVGNREFPGYRMNFSFDFTPPNINSIKINNGQNYSNTTQVFIDLNAKDSLSGLENISYSLDNKTWTAWNKYKTQFYVTFAGDGEKFIRIRVRDRARNVAEVTSDPIILDSKPPEDLSIRINNGSKETNSTKINLMVNAIDTLSGIHKMSFSENGKTWGRWMNFSDKIDYDLSAGDGKKTIYFRIKDRAGNVGGPVNTSIFLNSTEPEKLEDDNDKPSDSTPVFSSTPIFWVIIIIVVFVILVILFINLFYKRRDKEEKIKSVLTKPASVKSGKSPDKIVAAEVRVDMGEKKDKEEEPQK